MTGHTMLKEIEKCKSYKCHVCPWGGGEEYCFLHSSLKKRGLLLQEENPKIRPKRWNVRKVGDTKTLCYVGLKTKKEAIAIAEDWNSNPTHETKLEVVEDY